MGQFGCTSRLPLVSRPTASNFSQAGTLTLDCRFGLVVWGFEPMLLLDESNGKTPPQNGGSKFKHSFAQTPSGALFCICRRGFSLISNPPNNALGFRVDGLFAAGISVRQPAWNCCMTCQMQTSPRRRGAGWAVGDRRWAWARVGCLLEYEST